MIKRNPDLLRPQEAASFLGIAENTLYRWKRRYPDFPKTIKASERLCYYRKSDLDAWLVSREV